MCNFTFMLSFSGNTLCWFVFVDILISMAEITFNCIVGNDNPCRVEKPCFNFSKHHISLFGNSTSGEKTVVFDKSGSPWLCLGQKCAEDFLNYLEKILLKYFLNILFCYFFRGGGVNTPSASLRLFWHLRILVLTWALSCSLAPVAKHLLSAQWRESETWSDALCILWNKHECICDFFSSSMLMRKQCSGWLKHRGGGGRRRWRRVLGGHRLRVCELTAAYGNVWHASWGIPQRGNPAPCHHE